MHSRREKSNARWSRSGGGGRRPCEHVAARVKARTASRVGARGCGPQRGRVRICPSYPHRLHGRASPTTLYDTQRSGTERCSTERRSTERRSTERRSTERRSTERRSTERRACEISSRRCCRRACFSASLRARTAASLAARSFALRAAFASASSTSWQTPFARAARSCRSRVAPCVAVSPVM